MSTDDPNDASSRMDAAFEQRLLDSAKSDAPAHGAAEQAWSRFAASAGALPIPSTSREPGGSATAASGAAMKWFGIGALGGTLVTATWMGALWKSDAPAAPARPTHLETTSVSALDSGSSSAEPASPGPAPAAAPTSAAPDVGRRDRVSPPRAAASMRSRGAEAIRRARRPGGAELAVHPAVPAPDQREASPPISSTSTLEREVAMLDAVRTALTRADFDGAVALVAEYRREFEHGELARDADVFEIEAFSGRGDRARATRAAREFWGRYPRDPHVGRLRELSLLEPR